MSYECNCPLHLTQPVDSVSLMCVLRRAHVQQGLSNWLCLSVVRPLSVQKKKNLNPMIYRVKQFLNPTVTLEHKISAYVYLIATKALQFYAFQALLIKNR